MVNKNNAFQILSSAILNNEIYFIFENNSNVYPVFNALSTNFVKWKDTAK